MLSAEISDIKFIYNVLKILCHQEFAVVQPMEEGLKITLSDNKCSETSIYIPQSAFSTYKIKDNSDVKFKVSLKVLTECLHIFGDEGHSMLKMSYKKLGDPLILMLKQSDENIIVDCELSTMDADEFVDISLADECNMNNIVLAGDSFFDIISDLDMLADDIQFVISNKAPYFQITTTSVLGISHVDISKHSDMVNAFNCKSDFKEKYSFSIFKQLIKIMALASKISISTGNSGLLGFQIIINSDDRQLFVEYYVTALINDSDD